MVTRDEQVAIAFLAYLVLPVLLLFLWWAVGWVRRRFFKRGEPTEEGGAEPEV